MVASELLKANILGERTIAWAGGVRPALRAQLSALGAHLIALDENGDDLDAEAWAAEHGPVHGLVYDAAASFADGGGEALRAAIDDGWNAIHAVATAAFIPSGRGAAIVLLAPRTEDGAYAAAVRAALENTSRSLSIEWARFGITTTVIAPGAGTTEEDIATLVAFLLSRAGRYFSGCRFELGAVGREGPFRA
jgi:NAD(P)-dependent dehydrogenase (short-subunit alcohol dehydrogenase family)